MSQHLRRLCQMLVIIVILYASAPPLARAQTYVFEVYNNPNYAGGWCYSNSPMTANIAASCNDQISSILLATGWSARLFRDQNQSGPSFCLNRSDWDLGDNTYEDGSAANDTISSFILYNQPWCGGSPVPAYPLEVYTDTNYGGFQCYSYQAETANIYSACNDQVSSVLLRTGWSMRIYRDQNQGGPSACLTASDADLSDNAFDDGTAVNDAISSFVLYSQMSCAAQPPSPAAPTLYTSATSLPANNVTTTQITLAGAPAGHRVRFASSRGSVDSFGQLTGTLDGAGRFSTTLRSSVAGTASVTAQDLTTGATFATSVRVVFLALSGPQPPVNSKPVRILNVASRYDLSGFFPIGFGSVANPVDVTIDWGGRSPGKVRFQVNGRPVAEQPASGSRASYMLELDRILSAGANSLSITAVAADGARSAATTYIIRGWTDQDGWLQALAASLVNDPRPDRLTLTLYLPRDPNYTAEFIKWLPGRSTKLGPQAMGQLEIGLKEGTYDLQLGGRFARSDSTPGRKPWYGRHALKILGNNDIETDFVGTAHWKSTAPFVTWPSEIGVEASGKISFEASESVLVVVEPLAPAGPFIVNGLKAVPPVYDWVKDRAKFYIELTPELGGQATWTWGRGWAPTKVNLYTQLELEGGIKFSLYAAEGKVYATGGSRIDWGLYPQLTMDQWKFYGKLGYEIRSLWFRRSGEKGIEWIAYQRGVNAVQLQDLLSNPSARWSLIPRTYVTPTYTHFAQRAGIQQFSGATSSALQSTSPLVTTIFPYAEPSLAVRPDNQALLVWAHDDTSRPQGQGYDLLFSRWNGNAWTTPAKVVNDAYPDGSPQVAWLANGQAIAVWQRLDNATLAPDATLDTTQLSKTEIAWATYDPITNTWSTPKWLTRNSPESNLGPVLSRADDGSVWVAWRSNPQNQLSGDSQHPDQIKVARWNGSGWSAAQIATSNIVGITDIALGHSGSQATLAWTAPATPTGSVSPTLQLFTSTFNGNSWGVAQRVTTTAVQHRLPQVIYRQGQPFLVWLAGDQLTLESVLSLQLAHQGIPLSVAGIPVKLQTPVQVDQFHVLQNSTGDLLAVFTGQQQQQRDLYLAFYDQATGTWGHPQPLTHDQASERYPASALDSSGALLMAYARTQVTDQVRTTTDPATGQPVTYTEAVEGPTDLYTLQHTLQRNLAIESLQLSDEHARPGSTVVLSATIRNRGDVPVMNVPYTFQDNGAVVTSGTFPTSLVAGQAATVTATYLVPTTGGLRQLSAVVDPANSIAETSEADNRITVNAFGPDLVVDSVVPDYWSGTDVGVVTRIRNQGTSMSPATTLRITRDSGTGPLLISDSVPALSAGQAITLTTPWNTAPLSTGSYTLTATVNSNEFPERFTDNNQASTTLLVQPDLAVSSDAFWTTPLAQATVGVTVTVLNNGPVAATNITVGFYRRNTLSSPDLQATRTIAVLAPGTAVDVTAQLPGPLGCGVYVVVDPLLAITETTRLNNVVADPTTSGRCADFWTSVASGHTPLTVSFNDTSTGTNTRWVWDFGDGTTSTERSPVHVYDKPGVYDVKLRVAGPDGADNITRAGAIVVYSSPPGSIYVPLVHH